MLESSRHTAVSLDSLYARADLWRGRLSRQDSPAHVETGFDALDQALHLGGWPAAGLVELLCQTPAPQALRLLLPALSRLQDGLLVLANPPARPQANTLKQAGIHSANLLVMRSQDSATLLRACREAAASGAASAMVAWLPPGCDTPSNLRRLHLAAQQGRCLLVLIRNADQGLQASPAPLRLRLQAAPPAQMHIEVVKQPGGWGGQTLELTLAPERISQPLAACRDMPAPDANAGTARVFRDPDSRFGWRATRTQPIQVASPVNSPVHNLALPL